MDRESAERIEDELFNLGADFELREDYSGRAMYGETTAAFVFDDWTDVALLGYAAAQADVEASAIEGLRSDNMGRGLVVY